MGKFNEMELNMNRVYNADESSLLLETFTLEDVSLLRGENKKNSELILWRLWLCL